MLLDNISRKRAFLTHLGVSFSVFLVMLWLILFHWYPSFFLTLDGGYRGITTIFIVDVVLGPGLTLLVFKPGKPGLKFDLVVILIVQLSALVWGVSKVYEDRSVAAAFYLGKFTCLSATAAEKVPPAISSGEYGHQKLAFLQRPDTYDEYTNMLNASMQAGSSEVYFFADRFQPLDEKAMQRVRSYALDLEELRKDEPELSYLVHAYTREHKGYNEDYGLYPISCRFGNSLAVLNYASGEITGTFGTLANESRLRAHTSITMQ